MICGCLTSAQSSSDIASSERFTTTNATLTILDLAGSVALLLWGVHMVQTGIQRALGAKLRVVLGVAPNGRLRAFAAGIGITAILQSSTATGLMVTGFAAHSLVDLVPAVAVMLGANVGSTIIVQVLSFDMSEVSPLLILLGVFMFRRGITAARDFGRVFVGLGLMLLALHRFVGLPTPYEDAPSLRLLAGALATEPVIDAILAAGLAWAAHSSVVVVLLAMSFAAKGIVPLDAAFAMVLGANLGSALNPFLEKASGQDPAARRLPLGNLLNRILGILVALASLPWIGRLMVDAVPDKARAVADFHTLFNLTLAAAFLPLLSPFARLLGRLLPARIDAADPAQPLHLDHAALGTPVVALGGAVREAMRMADILEVMLQGAREALVSDDRRRVGETRRIDDVLDKLDVAIKSYLTSLDAERMSDDDHRRVGEILCFIIQMEQAGDVVDKELLGVAARRIKRGLVFSAEAQEELAALIDRLIANLRAGAASFVTGDTRAARLLANEKEVFRAIDSRATGLHLDRLRNGSKAEVEASTLHLEALRDLKGINIHVVAAAAYPVLESQGELLPSRLRQED